jgi:hypothetical protein
MPAWLLPSTEEQAYDPNVPVFLCRWPNGDLSFVSFENEEDAIVMLDEWDNAELAELTQVEDFMVDFSLTDRGELELQAFGEHSEDDIRDRPIQFSLRPSCVHMRPTQAN